LADVALGPDSILRLVSFLVRRAPSLSLLPILPVKPGSEAERDYEDSDKDDRPGVRHVVAFPLPEVLIILSSYTFNP
jgi:hypothetical protein